MKTQTQWLFETPMVLNPLAYSTPYSFHEMDDDRSVDSRIPTGTRNAVEMGVANSTYPTRGEAQSAAKMTASGLGAGYKVFHEGKHGSNQLPHYHITGPDGRVKGKFFYGGQPFYDSPKGKPEKVSDITQKAGEEVRKSKPKDGLLRREKNTNKVAAQAIEARAAKANFQREYETNYLFEATFPSLPPNYTQRFTNRRVLPSQTRQRYLPQLPANRGSRDYIRWVQTALNQILGLNLTVDGLSGPATRNAVRRFQSLARLQVDGIVGPKTEAAITSFATSSTTIPTQNRITPCPLRPGESRNFTVSNYRKDEHGLREDQSGMYLQILDTLRTSFELGCVVSCIKIMGHTSTEGDRGYNMRLGQRRANEMERRLKQDLGANSGKVKFCTSSAGASAPFPPCGMACDEADHRSHRRVEVTLCAMGGCSCC